MGAFLSLRTIKMERMGKGQYELKKKNQPTHLSVLLNASPMRPRDRKDIPT